MKPVNTHSVSDTKKRIYDLYHHAYEIFEMNNLANSTLDDELIKSVKRLVDEKILPVSILQITTVVDLLHELHREIHNNVNELSKCDIESALLSGPISARTLHFKIGDQCDLNVLIFGDMHIPTLECYATHDNPQILDEKNLDYLIENTKHTENFIRCLPCKPNECPITILLEKYIDISTIAKDDTYTRSYIAHKKANLKSKSTPTGSSFIFDIESSSEKDIDIAMQNRNLTFSYPISPLTRMQRFAESEIENPKFEFKSIDPRQFNTVTAILNAHGIKSDIMLKNMKARLSKPDSESMLNEIQTSIIRDFSKLQFESIDIACKAMYDYFTLEMHTIDKLNLPHQLRVKLKQSLDYLIQNARLSVLRSTNLSYNFRWPILRHFMQNLDDVFNKLNFNFANIFDVFIDYMCILRSFEAASASITKHASNCSVVIYVGDIHAESLSKILYEFFLFDKRFESKESRHSNHSDTQCLKWKT
jgi:hypothetical protein